MSQTLILNRLQVFFLAITSILPILNHSLQDFDKCNWWHMDDCDKFLMKRSMSLTTMMDNGVNDHHFLIKNFEFVKNNISSHYNILIFFSLNFSCIYIFLLFLQRCHKGYLCRRCHPTTGGSLHVNLNTTCGQSLLPLYYMS